MTMYILSDDDVVNALISQHQAGREVKVVLNQNLPPGSSNSSVYSKLSGAGVPVVWAPSQFTYTHEKCFIVDGREAWIMTMNASYSSPQDNREYLAVDDVPADVAEAEAVFEGDYAGTPLQSVTGPLLVAPLNAHTALVSFLQTAHTSIDLEVEELSDANMVTALVNAVHAGIPVRIVIADGPDSAQTDAANQLKAAGAQVVTLSTPYVHAKAIVVDGTTAFVGSENFTQNSLDDNRELGVIFAVPSEVQKVASTIAQDFANGTPF
jgi:phosphatidylserine/phosphatidylglycerophosphate/cardiolipin synthase-like enzyme